MARLFTSVNIASFQQSLLVWYHKNKRDLPWRRTHDPYAIWLSEIMLTQTTVETVIPYFKRFLKQFPTLNSVASAKEEKLLKEWAGLGYYNRIRHFQEAARQVTQECGGRIPRTKNDLMQLPGLGDYTAAAVAGIAFGEPVAVVDGNVMRVLARLFAFSKDITTTTAKKFFREKADALLDEKNPGDFNQAMMELGATVCTKQKVDCLVCPVQKYCRAFKTGMVGQLPYKKKKIKFQEEEWFALISKKENSVMLRQRKKPEIMAGMWEFPLTLKIHGTHFKTLKPIHHTIMNKRMSIKPVLHEPENKKDGKWIAWTQTASLPLTTITRKIIDQNRGLFP